MRYLYKRGRGAKRRVMHLCGYDPRTGQPTMVPLCERDGGLRFDTTCNFPLGQRVCRRCRRVLDLDGNRAAPESDPAQ